VKFLPCLLCPSSLGNFWHAATEVDVDVELGFDWAQPRGQRKLIFTLFGNPLHLQYNHAMRFEPFDPHP